MSYIKERRSQLAERNQEKITVSLRLSQKINYILEELADEFETTRQEIILDLINQHIVQEWESERNSDKDKDDNSTDNESDIMPPTAPRYFLLNTNIANDIQDHEFMLDNQLAAAFEDGWMQKINHIKKGDYVFLYASGKGIVGYGVASGKVEKTDHYGVPDKTFFQKLSNFKDVSKNPVKASQVKVALGRNTSFLQVLTKVDGGEKILEYIKDREKADKN